MTIARMARLARNEMTGISAAKSDKIRKLTRFASAFAASNLSNSGFCELIRRMSAAPKMLSLITLLSQSIASCDLTKSFRTLPKTKKKVPAISGMIARTKSASLRSVMMSRTETAMMRKIEEMSEETAIEMNVLTASTSEVRLVKSLAGVAASINAYGWTEIEPASSFLKSRATRSAA